MARSAADSTGFVKRREFRRGKRSLGGVSLWFAMSSVVQRGRLNRRFRGDFVSQFETRCIFSRRRTQMNADKVCTGRVRWWVAERSQLRREMVERIRVARSVRDALRRPEVHGGL